jgi:hypothetical protein
MKKLGLFTNFQFDRLFQIYQENIKSLVTKHYRGVSEPNIEPIYVLPQGIEFARDNKTVNSGLFESCFRSAVEYAINVQHCDVIALCFDDTYLHSLGEEIFAEDEQVNDEAKLISLVDCALAVCKQRKRFRHLGLLSNGDIRDDNYTRERFQTAGYEISMPFNAKELSELNRQATIIDVDGDPEDIDVDQLRSICSFVESITKAEKINGLLTLGYFELCGVFAHSGLTVPVVNLVEEHIKAIANAILSQ